MAATVKNTLNNENGMAMVIVLLMLAIITILGIGATQTSTTEVQLASNERRLVDEFYKAEGGLLDTLERSNVWLTNAYLLASQTTANFTTAVNFNGGTNDAIAEIRDIEKTGTPVAGLSSAANSLPTSSHTGPPPAGSGYSMGKFEVHRYGVTVTSIPGNTQVQAGVWKVFNKF
ncbi:MAG: pilus assembly PilX N-terminal domain-containing protein [Deltaproteobacteria bacterium]|nr:pilus assembly PilX N-terminal domain-containing protein [Deltaproteobacteria bacterium]